MSLAPPLRSFARPRQAQGKAAGDPNSSSQRAFDDSKCILEVRIHLFGSTWRLTFSSLSWLPLQSVFKETLKAFQTGLRLFITVCNTHTDVTPSVNYGAAAASGRRNCLSPGVITSVLCTSDSVPSSFIRNISRKGSDLLKKSFKKQKQKKPLAFSLVSLRKPLMIH